MNKTTEDRFWAKVEKTETCWLWRGSTNGRGYGNFYPTGPSKKPILPHRYSYEIHHGAVPDGLYVCHSCDVRTCVRPDHLFAGTHKDNMHDAATKGRIPGWKATHSKGILRGERHGRSKLKKEQVLEIRRLLASGMSGRSIAFQFGVSPAAVYGIARGETWRHLP